MLSTEQLRVWLSQFWRPLNSINQLMPILSNTWKKTMSNYNFDGYDWTELAEYFNVTTVNLDADEWDEDTTEYLAKHIWNTFHYGTEEEATNVVNACRAYLTAYINLNNTLDLRYSIPLMMGLMAIEHNETFLSYFIQLLPCLWT